jgi:hypothetical protein
MRRFFTITVLLFSLSSFGQNPKIIVPDTAVINFMTWLLKSDTSFTGVRHVNRNVMPGYFDFEYNALDDSIVYHIDTTAQKLKYKWELKIKGIKLVDEPGDFHPKNTTFFYSLPRFSLDKKYLIIQTAFYCGLVCGGGESILYKRQSGNTWAKVKQFGEWAE